jgi:outer membrane protein
MKRVVFLTCFLAIFATLHAGAQQLTRFAAVDLEKVTLAFFKDSKAYRDFEEQSTLVQKEIDRLNAEIQGLRNSQAAAESRGDREQALRLGTEIYNKSEYLREYYRAKTAELEDQKNKLVQSDAFWKQINNEIRYIAESEGYTMVLNAKDDSILWYSASVDITDKLIQNLRSKR